MIVVDECYEVLVVHSSLRKDVNLAGISERLTNDTVAFEFIIDRLEVILFRRLVTHGVFASSSDVPLDVPNKATFLHVPWTADVLVVLYRDGLGGPRLVRLGL